MNISETAAEATLRADRDKEIALADADLQKQLTGNESAHTTAVNNANSAHSTATANAEAARKSAEQAALTQLNSTLAQATKDKEVSIAGAERTYDQVVASLDAQYGSESSNGDTGVEGATRRSAIKTRDAQYYAARDTSWANTLSGSINLGTTPWTVKAISAANSQAAYSTSRANAQAAHDAAMLDAIEDWQLSSRESLTDLLFTEGQSRETYNVATSNVYANWENGVGNLLGGKPARTGWFVSGNSDEASSPLSPNVHEPKLRTHDDLVTTDEESQPKDDELDRPEINESELSAELKDAISEYNKVFAEGLQGAGNRKITTEELKALVRGIPGLQVYWGTDIVIVTIDEHQFVFVYESRTEMLDGPAFVWGENSYAPTRTEWFWSYKGMVTGYTTSSILWNHESDKSMPWIKGQEIVLETTLHLLPGGTLADKLVNETDENIYYVALTTAGDLTLIGGLYFNATTRLGKAVLLADVAVNGVGAGAAAYQYANSEEGRAAHAGEFVLRLAAMGLGANSLRLSNAKGKIAAAAAEAQALEKVADNAPVKGVGLLDDAAGALVPIRRGDGLRHIIDIRRSYEASGDILSARKNIAYAEINTTAFQGELRAISGETARAGFVSPSNIRLFRTREAGGFFRGFDSETHLLEDLAKRLTPDSFGTVRLFSERPVCAGCQDVIKQFQQMFPKIKIVVSGGVQ